MITVQLWKEEVKPISYREQLISALVLALIAILQALTLFVVAYINSRTHRIEGRQRDIEVKVNETNDKTSRIEQKSDRHRATDADASGDSLP